MLQFKDFAPAELTPPGFFNLGVYAALDDAVAEANAWITETGAKVMNVETVVLPNIHMAHEEGTTDPQINTSERTSWHQFVRVWYQVG